MQLKTNDYWVTGFNYLEDVVKDLNIPKKVELYDVTLREGNQTPGCILRKEEQLAIAKDLDEMGSDFIEFFPAVSQDDYSVLKELSKPGVLKHAVTSALVRPRTNDLELALECGTKHIFLEGPSHLYLASKMGYTSEDELIESFVVTAKEAKKHGMTITACPWDCGKATVELMERWVKSLAEAGVDDIRYGDTFGYTLPWTVMYMIRKFREWAGPDVVISTHFHNDYGLATANSLAAVAAGATRIQVAMNNLGERAGNTPLDEVAINLELNMGVKTNIKMNKLYPVSRKIEAISKYKVGSNKPITGEAIFNMGSGIVVDVLQQLKKAGESSANFAPFRPQFVGRPNYKVVYGKGTGRHMIENLIEKLGYTATDEQIKTIVNSIKDESMLTKSLLSDFRVEEIIKETLNISE